MMSRKENMCYGMPKYDGVKKWQANYHILGCFLSFQSNFEKFFLCFDPMYYIPLES